MTDSYLDQKLLTHLKNIYDEERAPELFDRLIELITLHMGRRDYHQADNSRWDEKTDILITYDDSMQYPGTKPLPSLKQFLDQRLQNVFNLMHLLPFYPFSSDGGFTMTDYRAVNPNLDN